MVGKTVRESACPRATSLIIKYLSHVRSSTVNSERSVEEGKLGSEDVLGKLPCGTCEGAARAGQVLDTGRA